MSTGRLTLRDATRHEVPAIVRMLADDKLGAAREHVGEVAPEVYYAAFDAIAANPNDRMLVASIDDTIVGCLQLTLIPGLSRRGVWRAQIESVRIASDQRGGGIGRQMIEAAIAMARQAGAGIVQLTTDKARVDARRFYESLGFVASHEGMKLSLG